MTRQPMPSQAFGVLFESFSVPVVDALNRGLPSASCPCVLRAHENYSRLDLGVRKPDFRVTVSNLQCITCSSPGFESPQGSQRTPCPTLGRVLGRAVRTGLHGATGRADGQECLGWTSDPGVALEPGKQARGVMAVRTWAHSLAGLAGLSFLHGQGSCQHDRVGYCSPGTGGHTNCACYRVRVPTVRGMLRRRGEPWALDHQRCATNFT